VPESHERVDAPRPSFPRRRAPFAILACVVIAGIIAWAALRHRPGTSEKSSATNSAAVVSAPPVLFTNEAALRASDPRWAGVLGVLQAMKDWSEANPVCHLLITTEGMGGKTYSDTEMFRFKDADSTNLITRIKIHLRFPNEVTFIVEKTGEDVIAYLPETDQLLKVDAAKEIASQYGLDLQNPGTASFFNLLRIAFVETNGTHRAITFAFKSEVLNVPSAASADAFTTLRIDEKGALQTIEQTVGAEHHVMQVKYLGFNQDDVSRAAPQIPANKPVVTGKSFNLALQEEIIKLRDKGTRI
jgi:hypothetical protein